METNEPIGGFLELDLPAGRGNPHAAALHLASGSACFEYILAVRAPRHVHLPRLTCDAMLEPLRRRGVAYTLYTVDACLETAPALVAADGELLVYTNYFGVKDRFARHLAQQQPDRLVLDCSQALYFEPPAGVDVFYSPRKFFGLPDGGLLYTAQRLAQALEQDQSHQRFGHLVKRIDVGPEAAYADFQRHDASVGDGGLRTMSTLTRRLLQAVDFDAARQQRLRNFAALHRQLQAVNEAAFLGAGFAVPLTYPLRVAGRGDALRRHLLAQRIFTATYWPNVLQGGADGASERSLAQDTVHLPLDQRYTELHMNRIAGAVLEHLA